MRNLNAELQRAIQIFQRHRWWFIQALMIVVGGSILFAWYQVPVYRSTVRIAVDTRDQERTTIREFPTYNLPSDLEREAILNTHTKLMESLSLSLETIDILKAGDPTIVEVIPKLLTRPILRPHVVPDTYIIALNAEASTAKRATLLASTAARLYANRNLHNLQGKARTARVFIEQQLGRTREQLAAQENKIRRYRTREKLVYVEHQRIDLINTLSDLAKVRMQMKRELQSDEAKLASLRHQMGDHPRAAFLTSKMVGDAGVRKLREEYLLAQADAVSVRLKYPSTSPLRVQADQRVREIYRLLTGLVQSGLRRYPEANPALKGPDSSLFSHGFGTLQDTLWTEWLLTDMRRAGAAAPLKAVDDLIAQYERQATELPGKEIELARMERELDVEVQRYRMLSQKMADVALQEAAQFNNLQIVEEARLPKRPVWPDYLVITAVALLAGSLLGLGLVFLVHHLDETVYDEDVGAIFKNLPQLSVIPWYGVPNRPYSPLDAFTVFPVSPPPNLRVASRMSWVAPSAAVDDATLTLEAYRTLRANLRLLEPSPEAHKVIAFLGATDIEGRASIVAGAAASFALTGERTIIVDTNFRGSTLARIMHLPEKLGLSDVITGATDWRSAIHTIKCGFVEGFSDLDIITPGTMPLYPTELLESDEMRDLILELKQEYELVIIHTSSLLTAIDGLIVAAMADLNLLVVGSKRIYRSDVLMAKQYLEIAKIQPLGFIIKLFAEERPSWWHRSRANGAR